LRLATQLRKTSLPNVLSANEVTRLLQAALSLQDELLSRSIFGIRRCVIEARRLRWFEIEFDRQAIRVVLRTVFARRCHHPEL